MRELLEKIITNYKKNTNYDDLEFTHDENAIIVKGTTINCVQIECILATLSLNGFYEFFYTFQPCRPWDVEMIQLSIIIQ